MSTTTQECPKRMVFGPCGGVHEDGRCEVSESACAFVGPPTVLWTPSAVPPPPADHPDALRDLLAERGGRHPAAEELASLVAAGRVVTADLVLRTTDATLVRDLAAELSAGVTAVVAGDPTSADRALAPSHRAALLAEAGLRVIAGVTCRDRNRVALEGELAALADIGVSGVLAVTGDYPARGDAKAVFDLDSTRLAALSRRAGHLTAVAEQPAVPTVERRVARLAQKIAAGAELCFLNLPGDVGTVARFARRMQEAGATVPLIVGVPVISSAEAVERLERLPGVALPPGLARALADAADPVAAGADHAVALAEDVLAIDGVAGVHLSAVAGTADPSGAGTARLLAAVGARIREGGSR